VLAGGGLLSTALCVFPLLIPSIRQLRA